MRAYVAGHRGMVGGAILRQLQIPFEAKVTSAHRTPAATHEYVLDADARGCAVFIAAAGMAAHLAGAVSATTVKPVIGVPMNASMDGLDALLSTVQMPAGIPVATVAIGAGRNAGLLAARIIGAADASVRAALLDHQRLLAEVSAAKDRTLRERLEAGTDSEG